MIEVYIHQIEKYESKIYSDFYMHLSTSLQSEIKSYKFIQDRIRKIIGRMLLNKALSSSHYSLEDIDKNQFGKPFIKDWCSFSISHSRDIVALAFDDDKLNIGIDIEFHSNVSVQDFSGQLHPNELDLVHKLPNTLNTFYSIWTRKEALLKAIGTGLNNDLSIINCSNLTTIYFNKEWYFYPIDVKENYTMHLASEKHNSIINIKHFSLNEISIY
jgi:4'-phosphopantetheinyl transferase